MQDIFLQRKIEVLSKEDKSFIGKWDEKIISLCKKINSLEDYYTTSSCSGRIVLIVNQEKKEKNLFLFVSHKKISLKILNKELKKLLLTDKSIKFKLEPFIIHVNAKTLEDAKSFLEISKEAGFKKMGIIGLKNGFTVEIQGSERLEFPIIKDKKILVDENFLRILVEETNKKLEKNWKKIRNLERLIQKIK